MNSTVSAMADQSNTLTVCGPTTQHGFAGPNRPGFDSSGNLWVPDERNNRVLEFKPPFSNGMNASLVIGQPDFVSYQSALTQSGVHTGPFGGGVAIDASGNLWVGDTYNNRVLEFEPPFSTGMKALFVIGQQDFTNERLFHDTEWVQRTAISSIRPIGQLMGDRQ